VLAHGAGAAARKLRGEQQTVQEEAQEVVTVSSPGQTENELMRAFYGCEETAFEEIDARWRPALIRYFRRQGWSEDRAEDLAQEALIRVHQTKPRERGRYDLQRPFSPWIYRIAYHLSSDARQQASHRPQISSDDVDVAQEPQKAAARAVEADLEECLQRLTDQEREFIVLWEGSGGELSQTEIARQMGLSNARISGVKESALRKLRECMEEKGYH
jgi:RNA polymerase sigma factor (sigma-70 family)